MAVDGSWSLEYHVPWSLFAKYHKTPAPTKGTVYRANLYKCADQTSHPHWVRTTTAALHRRLEPSKGPPSTTITIPAPILSFLS